MATFVILNLAMAMAVAMILIFASYDYDFDRKNARCTKTHAKNAPGRL